MKVGYFQFNPQFGKLEENRKQIEKVLSEVDAVLIVLPELPVSGYFFSNKAEMDPGNALKKNITEFNDVFEDRRTDIYRV